jgi:hypothetical protein
MARNSRNFDVRCPICAPKDASKKKLSIHVESDAWHCWVCGAKGRSLWGLVRDHGAHEQLVEYRDRFMPPSARRDSQMLVEASPTEKVSLPDDFRLLVTAPSSDREAMAIRSYLMGRNVTERDMWFYKMGYSNDPVWRRRAIMTSFDASGELNLYVGRAIDKYRKPKYEMPAGDRKHVIFNELNIDWNKQLVLCEGPLDVVKCGDNAIPLLGSDLNTEGALFNAIVAHNTPVALAMDADMKTTKMPRLAKKLQAYNVEVLIVDVITDPGAMTKQEFKEALKLAHPFDWSSSFLDRLDVVATMSLR